MRANAFSAKTAEATLAGREPKLQLIDFKQLMARSFQWHAIRKLALSRRSLPFCLCAGQESDQGPCFWPAIVCVMQKCRRRSAECHNHQVVQENIMAKKATGGTRIVPLGDRVVVKRAEAEATTSGGIVLPDSAQGKPQEGEVIAIGDGHINDKGERVALTVKEGDKVIFSSYAGDEISVGDEDYLLLRESDILATL
jgi:chaperonin GroES